MVFSDADREALIELSDERYLLQTKYSDHRQPKLLGHCTTVAETVGGLAEGLGDRDAGEEIVRWINRTYDNVETNRDVRIALRGVGRRVTDGEGGSGERGEPSSEGSHRCPISPEGILVR
jgi:hypothetical protein